MTSIRFAGCFIFLFEKINKQKSTKSKIKEKHLALKLYFASSTKTNRQIENNNSRMQNTKQPLF